MKKMFIVISILIGILYISQQNRASNVSDRREVDSKRNTTQMNQHVTNPTTTKSLGIFVPYWNVQHVPYLVSTSLSKNSTTELYYFGITTDDQGEILRDDGFAALDDFVDQAHTQRDAKTFLTVRLTNGFDNLQLLDDIDQQNNIVKNTVKIAHEYDFDGIVLDLEVSAIPSDKLKSKINTFVTSFSKSSHEADLLLYTTVFGDVLFRERPYDISQIAAQSDKMLVMAYDFHKASGTPGPNFPLKEEDLYAYSLHTLLQEMRQRVEPKKTGLVFGLYGYEWITDSDMRPLKPARALFLSAISEQKNICQQNIDCAISTDKASAELHISWKDHEGYYHHYWTETIESINKKIAEANRNGIPSIAFWAHGYY